MKRETVILSGLAFLFVVVFLVSFRTSPYPSDSGSSFSASSSFIPKEGGVAVIHLHGPISISNSSSGFFDVSGSDLVVDQIKRLETNKQVKALVLRVNSPGGTVGASQEIYSALMRYKATTKVPVVVSIGDVGASGAYWISMAGDTVFANAGSLVGSIGVIISSPDFTDIAEKFGVGMNTYKSVPHKDLLSSFRKPTVSEKEMLNALVENVHEQFVATVMAGRHMTRDQVNAIADGRVMTGLQAQDAGLIDEVGGFYDAILFAAKQGGITGTPHLIKPPRFPIDSLLDMVAPQNRLHGLWPQLFQPLLMSQYQAISYPDVVVPQ